MDPATELEEEQRLRMEEIHFLQNICANLQNENDKDRLRRSMVVILYSHFEGFAKFCFELYKKAIENSRLKCCQVQPTLATAALKDIFKALRYPESGTNFLPRGIDDLRELKPLAIERAFVERAWEFGQRPVSIPEDFVDLESNLKPPTLRKNLYRLGLPHNLFKDIEGPINKLLNYRNGIAHGSSLRGISQDIYTELYDAVVHVMRELKRMVLNAITTQAFRLGAASLT